MRFLSETKFYKKIIKSPSYLNPVAGIFMIRQEKKHETTPFGNFGQGGGGGTTEQFDFGPKEYHVNLIFQQAAQGVQKDMYVSIMDTCNKCKGWL